MMCVVFPVCRLLVVVWRSLVAVRCCVLCVVCCLLGAVCVLFVVYCPLCCARCVWAVVVAVVVNVACCQMLSDDVRCRPFAV